MAKIGITETVLRDAHQSLIATRMSAGAVQHLTPAFVSLMKTRGTDFASFVKNVRIQNYRCFSEVRICLATVIMPMIS